MASAALLDLEPRQHTRTHERGFARARGTVYDDQVFPSKGIDDRVDHFFTAEEDSMLIRFERP